MRDCVIVLKSEASSKRVMRTIANWIEKQLGLKVNMTKTHITKPQNLKYLDFGFYYNFQVKTWRSRLCKDSIKRFERKLKQFTCRRKNMSFKMRIRQLNLVIRGWINYYAISDMKTIMMKVDAYLRTRLRVILWKQWKVPSGRYHWLRKLGVNHDLAR